MNVREDSQIYFSRKAPFGRLGGREEGGVAGGRFKKISKKLIFDKTNFWNLAVFLNLYCLTKISIRAKRSISRVFSLFIVPSPFFCTLPVQRPY